MTLGVALRRLLGPDRANHIGRYYRAFFVDLDLVAHALAAAIPRGAHVLDVGGGDGVPLNHLLGLRADIHVTTIDPAAQVGQWIEPQHAPRVVRRPCTTLVDYLADCQHPPDVVIMVDVLHHIPPKDRPEVLGGIAALLHRAPEMRIIIKDVEPGSPRALLGYWADRYVTGDALVSPVSRDDVRALVRTSLGPLCVEETALFALDRPNYALVFFR
jgi:2-polyprenyl-3-methyl-5-hydroxy-6-metoxy-1,4-benzoquinol methylase